MTASDSDDAPAVAFVVSTPDRRGAEVFAVSLAAELTQRGWTTSIVALDRTSSHNALGAIRPLGNGRRSITTWRALLETARDCDVIVANGGTTLAITALAAMLTRTPFVSRNIGDPAAWGDVVGARLRLARPMRKARRVIALYTRAKQQLCERYGLDPDRVIVAPNAASSATFFPPNDGERAIARSNFNLDDSKKWVAFVGSLSEEKRPELAIESVLANDRLGLVLVGDGPLRETCELMASEDPERIRVVGQIDDVANLLHAVDVLAITSRTEGIAGAAIEAGLCALPVVTTDVGGMAELVEHGVSGLVVADPTPQRFAEALDKAAECRVEFGAAAHQRCMEDYELGTVADRWEAALRAGIDETPSRRKANP